MKPRNIARSLASLALTFCLCGLAIEQAHGQGSIVYVNPPDHQMLTTGGLTLLHDVDLDGNGSTDFVFRAGSSFSIYSTTGSRSLAIAEPPGEVGSLSVPLAGGFDIVASLVDPLAWQASFPSSLFPGSWIGQTFHVADDQGTFGYWQPQMTAYLGVEFQNAGNVHYGWIRLSTPFLPGVNGGVIEEWAYHLIPGQSILAGQVPEPGMLGLLVVGGGCLFWRCRRAGQREVKA